MSGMATTWGRITTSRLAAVFVVTAVLLGATAGTPVDAARRPVRRRSQRAAGAAAAVATTSTVVDTTLAPTTTAPAPIPPAHIVSLDVAGGAPRLRLDPPGRADLSAVVRVDALGMEEGTATFTLPPGVLDQAVGRTPDPDAQYTVHVAWKASDGTTGPEDVRVIPPRFAQPHYRGRVPVAGPGWSVLFTDDFVPTRRNPCAPIRVHYDPTNEPLNFLPTLTAALAQAAAASGVEITLVGTGRPRPTDDRVLVVDWTTGSTNYLGVTRQRYVRDPHAVVWRTTASISLAASRRVADGRWQTVILHELGHVLGLAHSHEDTSLMFSPVESGEPWPFVTTVYDEGDRRGLLAMNAGSSGGCSPTIDPTDVTRPSP